MKTKLFSLATLTLLAVSGIAAAADPAPAPAAAPPAAPTSATPAPPAATPPSATPAATTTVTSADTTPMPTTTEPPNRETVTLNQTIHPNRPLLYTGGIIFIGSYVATAALTAANTDGGGDKNMYIPVLGPWLHLADSNNNEGTADTLLVAGSGVVQGVGLGMAIASLFVPEKIPAATIQAGNVRMNVTPASFGRGSAGLGAVGEF